MGRLVKTGSGTSQNGRLIRVGESTVKPYFQTAQKRTVTALPNAGTPTADRARLGLATGGNPVSDSLTRFVEKKQTAPPPEVETPISSMNFTKGLGYGSERAGAAMLGAAENITDLIGAGFWKGVQGITSAGGLLPNPVSEYAERAGDAFLDNSVTRDWEESIRARYQPTQAEEAVTGVGQTVLQMLPGIGAAKAVSAAGNAANALNASNAARAGANAGRAVFGLQAAGGGANEARAEGATTGQALAYGAASGLLETAIESIAGGVPGLGKGKVREIAGAVISNPVVGKALDIAGEGGEEALSAVISPYLKRAIYDSDAEHATAEEIAQSAVMGALAAGVLQAGLELPGAISNAVSQVQSTRASRPANAALLDSLNLHLSQPGQVETDTNLRPLAAGQNNTTSTVEAEKVNPGARPSIRETVGDMPSSGYQIPYISMPSDALVGGDGERVTESKIPAAIRKYMIRLFRGKVLNIGSDHRVYIDKNGIEEFAFPVRRMDSELKTAKMTAGANLDTTLEPALFLLNTADDGHHPEVTGGWDNFYVMFRTDIGTYSGVVKTKVTDRGRVFHDITEIQKEGEPPTRGDNGTSPPPARTESPSLTSIEDILPATLATMLVSIFIASITING